MRKGDEKRQELLNVAEKLFCTKGYEATAVQDILDVLRTSKGGFYHYFSSKESVLETLCEQRAERFCEQAEQALSTITDPMLRLNTLLHYVMPLRMEEYAFISMLLPLMDRAEGLSCRVHYQEALTRAFRPILEREIALGSDMEVLYPVVRDAATPILLLVNACWSEACKRLLEGNRKVVRFEAASVLEVLETYRRSIEVLLDAPYGSVVMMQLEEWTVLAEKLLRQLRMPMHA